MKTKTNDGKPVKPRKMWAYKSHPPTVGYTCLDTKNHKDLFYPVLVIPLTAESVAEIHKTVCECIANNGGWPNMSSRAALTALGITPRKRVLRPSANKGGKAK